MFAPIRHGLRAAILPALVLASCSPAAKPVAAVPQPAPMEYGIIASLRPVLQAAPNGVATDPGARILAAIGVGVPAGVGTAPGEAEFVIRADDGRTLSIMQANDKNFRAGQRVALSGGPRMQVVSLAASRG
jgi:outer membrane lipoprotein SlyB